MESTPTDAYGSEISSDERVRREQLALVIAQTLKRQIFSPITAALLCVALWEDSTGGWLISWMLVFAAISLWRHLFSRAFALASAEERAQPHWEIQYWISLCANSAVWGFGAWLLMPTDSVSHQLLIYCFVLGVAGGTLSVYSIHGPSATLALSLILVPTSVALLASGEREQVVVSLGGLFFLITTTRGARMISESMRNNIKLSAQLESMARTDALSGLNNRRAFTELGETALARGERGESGCALIMLDVDHFKRINDRFGHAAGDAVIRQLGQLLRGVVRRGEAAGRIGGEEFALFLPASGITQARELAERILLAARGCTLTVGEQQIRFTVSLGVAATGDSHCSFDALLARADEALYRAKSEGRDRMVLHV